MRSLAATPNLTQRVHDALVDEILAGALEPGQHLVQEQIAAELGVSRQPVQQAMALLKADGLVEDAPGRGLAVTRLDVARMRHHYDIRAVLDEHAARAAAQRCAESASRADAFRSAVEPVLAAGAASDLSVPDRIRHDETFHRMIYDYSGNPVIAETASPNWRFLRRAMADVLRHATLPATIWDQHRTIAEAIASGAADRAAGLARDHASDAAATLAEALEKRGAA